MENTLTNPQKQDEICALLSIVIWKNTLDLYIGDKDFCEADSFENLKSSIKYINDTHIAQDLNRFLLKPEVDFAKNIKIKIENNSDFKKAQQQLDFKSLNLNKNYFLGSLFGIITKKPDD